MNCITSGKRIVLKPSATERARKVGGKPSDYTKLFTEHADCLIARRDREARALMKRICEGA